MGMITVVWSKIRTAVNILAFKEFYGETRRIDDFYRTTWFISGPCWGAFFADVNPSP